MRCFFVILLLSSLSFGSLRADLNGDGYANFDDFALFAMEWNMSDPNLVLHYKMDELTGTTVVDSSGNGHNGTLVRDASLMKCTGKIGGALNFDGANDYINVGNNIQPVFKDTFAVSLWIKPTDGQRRGSYNDLIHMENYPTTIGAFLLWIDNGYFTLTYSHDIVGLNVIEAEPDFRFADGLLDWQHVVFIIENTPTNSATVTIYVNKEVIFSQAFGNIAMSSFESSADLIIGKGHNSYDRFDGGIDDIRIYNKALTAAEVLELFLAGRDGGFYRVYRGQDGVIDYNNVQTIMGLNDTSVNLLNQNLPANSIWHYTRTQVSACGLESPPSDPHRIVINSEGTMILSTPNIVEALTAEPLAGGIIQLRWRYLPTGQEVLPTGFKIYMDSGSGFDFANPLATVTHTRSWAYKWKSAALNHGQTYRFCVRSYKANAGETINTNFVSAMADSVGPAAAQGLSVTWEEA